MVEPKSSLLIFDSKYRQVWLLNMSGFCCHYKLQFLQPKGAILVLLWDIIISLYEEFLRLLVLNALEIVHPTNINELNNTLLNVNYLVWLCCPLADS